MAQSIVGTVTLSPAAANVVHRNLSYSLNGIAQPVKDIISDPTFPCSEGDNYVLSVVDVDSLGSQSVASSSVRGVAQTPPPVEPTITGVTFALPA